MGDKVKLSEEQRAVLRARAEGDLIIRKWDVWGPRNTNGAWFVIESDDGSGMRIDHRTVPALERKGLLQAKPQTRPHGGHYRTEYELTDAGRAALAQED